MNQDRIVAIYVMVDDILKTLGHVSDGRAPVSDAEVLTLAIVAASECANEQKRALSLMQQLGYLRHRLSESRFNRRLHQLSDWLTLVADKAGALGRTGEAYIIDSRPLLVCRRGRARRCRKVEGVAYCGHCAAKKESFTAIACLWCVILKAVRSILKSGLPCATTAYPCLLCWPICPPAHG